ncbi:MAG: hypothetical protein HKM87_09035 [Ignavibacteriaceae bacterium]|nr:hypothetical protein [Ignavibacteriaceae bacterium]
MKTLITREAKQLLGVLLMFLIITFYGCENSTEVQPNGLTVTFLSDGSLAKPGNNSIQLNEVKILVRNLKFDLANSSGSSDIKLGPFVIHLNPNGMTTGVQVNDAPEGTYRRVKFEVHKLEDHEIPPDPEFSEGSSGSDRFSVIIKGDFNNTPFVYKSQRTTYQEIEFQSPLVINNNSAVNLTIRVNPYSWFFEEGSYLDPTDESNRSEIEMNIEHSFKNAFKDNNKDGLPD